MEPGDPVRRRLIAVRPAILAGPAIAVVALVLAHLADVGERDRLLRQFLADRTVATTEIARRYGVDAAQCAEWPRDELIPLAVALATVERFATSYLEDRVRFAASHAAAAAGVSLDITAGPARIRPSTARAALRAPLLDLDVLRRISSPCEAVPVVAAILQEIRLREGGETASDRSRFVQVAAAEYNGQAPQPRSFAAQVSAAIYSELVYEIYQHYRFALQARR